MPTDIDFAAGIDLTGLVRISQEQLMQLLLSAGPSPDVGFNITTQDQAGVPDLPDAPVTTKWERYLWRRVMPLTNSVSLYIWNPTGLSIIGYSDNSGNTVTSHWIPVSVSSIPSGSILGYMIAANTITKDKIVSIDISQVEGFSPTGYVSTASTPNAAGDIEGSFAAGLTIKNLAVTSGKVALLAIGTAQLADLGITSGKIALLAVGAAQLADAGITFPKLIGTIIHDATTQKLVPAATDRILLADEAAAGVTKWATLSSLGATGVYQRLVKASTGSDSTATVLPVDNTIPQIGEGKEYLVQAITTLSASSLIRVRVTALLASAGNTYAAMALFQDAVGNALQATYVGVAASALGEVATIEYVVASPGAGTLITYRVRFGPGAAGTGYINTNSGGVDLGARCKSYLVVEEIAGTLS